MINPAPQQFWCTKCDWLTVKSYDPTECCFEVHKEAIVLLSTDKIQYAMKRLIGDLKRSDLLQTMKGK